MLTLTSATQPPESEPPASQAPTTAIDPATIEIAAAGLSLIEQQHPATADQEFDLESCLLVDQATLDGAFAAVGQPQPFAPLTGAVYATSVVVEDAPMWSYQVSCRGTAPEGVTAPTSDVIVAALTKSPDVTMSDMIADSDVHTVTHDSAGVPVLGAAHLGYCYDYDDHSYCFQSFDYGTFAVVLKIETPPRSYDPAALAVAAQAVVPVVLQHLAAVAAPPAA